MMPDNYEKGYDLLAKAVVLQAIKDYQFGQTHYNSRNTQTRIKARRLVADTTAFFSSDYFNNFTDLNGNTILRLLKARMIYLKKNNDMGVYDEKN